MVFVKLYWQDGRPGDCGLPFNTIAKFQINDLANVNGPWLGLRFERVPNRGQP